MISRLRFNSVVVQDWYQSVPVQSTPTPDPCTHSNGGLTLGTHWSSPTHPLRILCEFITVEYFVVQKIGCEQVKLVVAV